MVFLQAARVLDMSLFFSTLHNRKLSFVNNRQMSINAFLMVITNIGFTYLGCTDY